MALSTSLVSYRKLDESSGNAVDQVGSHTLVNTSTNYINGKLNNCASFNGVSSTLGVADHADYDFGTGDFSISFWCYADTNTNYRPILNQRVGESGAQFNIAQTAGAGTGDQLQLYVYNGTNGNNITSGNNTHSTGVREHRVFTRGNSGADFNIYKNGTLIKTVTGQTARNADNTGTFSLGSDTQGNWRDGFIDEVGVWKGKALSLSEVISLYNGGNALPYPLTESAGSFISFF